MYSKQRGERYKLLGHQIWGFRGVLPCGGLRSGPSMLPATRVGRLVLFILIIIENFSFFFFF